MTNFGPRCPALHPDLPHSRCGLSEGHVGTHRNFTGNEWTDAPDYYEKLASALRNVRTDLADGGVTCAAIENEAKGRYVSSEEVAAYWHDRADKAERALADVHERDETVARLEGRLIEAEKSRRLTADDITDGMMARGLSAYWGQYQNGNDEEVVRDILASALTEPQRPEGAEDIKPEIQSWLRSATGGVGALTPERVERLADFLAERGVRVVTEEQP